MLVAQQTQEFLNSEFISKVKFLQHTSLLPFQKVSLVIDLCFDLFFGCATPANFVPSSATVSSWNVYFGEVDKIYLRTKFEDSLYEGHIWADDSNKGGSDRHVVGMEQPSREARGIHTWVIH